MVVLVAEVVHSGGMSHRSQSCGTGRFESGGQQQDMRSFMNSAGSMPSTMMSKLVVSASKYRFTRLTRSNKKTLHLSILFTRLGHPSNSVASLK